MTAKEYLQRVRITKQAMDEQREEYLLLQSRCTSTTSSLSGMSVGGTRDSHKDDKLIYFAEKGQIYWDSQVAYTTAYHDVKKFLEQMSDMPTFKYILELRYLNLHSWNYIKRKLSQFSERKIYNLHSDALKYAQKLLEQSSSSEVNNNADSSR